MRYKGLLLLLALAVTVMFAGCFGSTTTGPEGSGAGSAKFALTATMANFNDIADSAVVQISADDMQTITEELTIGTNTVTGTVMNIPVGTNRHFRVLVYDSAGTLQFTGEADANIIADTLTEVAITLARLNGGAIITGNIVEGYGVSVSTTPAGASIYLDGTLITSVSPTLISNVNAGEHTVRIYRTGYNEYSQTFTYTANTVYSITVTLGTPQPPYPVITFSGPANNAIFSSDDRVITVYGTIVLDNGNPYTGSYAILSMNGIDQQISVFNGQFTYTNSVVSGQNTIVVRANGPNGGTGVSGTLTVTGNFTEPDILVTLTWNTPTSDLDLHVWNPLGEHCYFGNTVISDGNLDVDDTEGYGPEHFTAQTGLAGVYTVQINDYDLDLDAYADATVVIKIKGRPAQIFGPLHFTVDDGMGTDPNAWWEVATFTVSGGVAKLAAPGAVQQKIAADMASLPRK